MPDKAIAEIDHLLTYVQDLDHAATLFRRMGFTLSPVSRIEGMGISNHLVLMHPPTPHFANYIELMASHDRSRLPPVMERVLAGGEGIKSMVLGAGDIAAAGAAIAGAGFAVDPPFHVKREWVIAPGESVFPEFDVILPVDAPLAFNCCRYFNVDLYLRPSWRQHDNGVQRLRSVIAASNDPAAVVAPLGRLFDCPPAQAGNAMRVSPGQVDLEVMPAPDINTRYGIDIGALEGTRYVGYVLQVESLDRMKACLDRGGVAYRVRDGRILVDPETGLGNLMVFESEGGR